MHPMIPVPNQSQVNIVDNQRRPAHKPAGNLGNKGVVFLFLFLLRSREVLVMLQVTLQLQALRYY